jgi:hypothetical protein
MSTAEIAIPAEVVEEVNAAVLEARAIVVNTPEEAQAATEFLSVIAGAKRKNESARRFLVDPLKKHAKAIDERFKANAAPLDEADRLVREKVIAFQKIEQERLAEEQRRLDAERAEREAQAERERQAALEEAQRVEREAREAVQRRQAELRAAASERAREIALMSDVELSATAEGQLGDDDAHLADREIAARRAARLAQEQADEARRIAEEAQQAQIAAASAPTAVVEATTLGSASATRRWKGTVVDATRVPREYLVVDQTKINAAVREGVREIPGVLIEQVDGLSVRAK